MAAQEDTSGSTSATATTPATAPAAAPAEPDTRPHVHYDLHIDTSTSQPPAPAPGVTRSDTDLQISPLLRRRTTRAATFKNIDEFDDFNPNGPGWQPGAEPGFDPAKPDGGHASMPTLSAPCEITVVDFSEHHMTIHHFENVGFISFLEEPQPAWSKCRWISVNGLSWDVIQALGRRKKLHSLALEDIMNSRNRTKADWYV
jgi:hypothetical protein